MKARYRLVKMGNRGGAYYAKDTISGSRTSLKTKIKREAETQIQALNESSAQPLLSRKLGLAYLSASDPELSQRTWQQVMTDIIQDKAGPTLRRWEIAIKDRAFDSLRDKAVVSTLAADFLRVLRSGTVSTNVYLRRLQNHCLDLGWLPIPILPKRKFPKIKHAEKRAITPAEHQKIVEREVNPERRDFYELCWHTGGSQSDVAALLAEDIDYERRCFAYSRKKTGSMGGMRLGPQAWSVIMNRPRKGPLFPYLITVRECDRATEFKQRCDGLGIRGITLHSYRYAWAQRSADLGYPERFAQRALGHNSKAVHRAYARRAQGELPSLEEFEVPAASGRILTLPASSLSAAAVKSQEDAAA